MQRVSRADSGQTAREAVGSGRECKARAVSGGSAPLPAAPRAELEDVVVETSPCRPLRRWNALHGSSVSVQGRGVVYSPAQSP
eukprot:6680570-Prymnesium_polylepis.1